MNDTTRKKLLQSIHLKDERVIFIKAYNATVGKNIHRNIADPTAEIYSYVRYIRGLLGRDTEIYSQFKAVSDKIT